MKTILAYGDSITYGARACGRESVWPTKTVGRRTLERGLGWRGPGDRRRPGGPDHRCMTTGTRDADRNGSRVLPTLLSSHDPLDLVIIMLGTNDLKPFHGRRSTASYGIEAIHIIPTACVAPLVQRSYNAATIAMGRPTKGAAASVPLNDGKIGQHPRHHRQAPAASLRRSRTNLRHPGWADDGARAARGSAGHQADDRHAWRSGDDSVIARCSSRRADQDAANRGARGRGQWLGSSACSASSDAKGVGSALLDLESSSQRDKARRDCRGRGRAQAAGGFA